MTTAHPRPSMIRGSEISTIEKSEGGVTRFVAGCAAAPCHFSEVSASLAVEFTLPLRYAEQDEAALSRGAKNIYAPKTPKVADPRAKARGRASASDSGSVG